ncbi:tetratricopeptide repeat protein [Microbispora cellulosiformans]|uniref:Tetratricopeptide repeat protein n=1 Tax=Microbispora cellulosiformans TaxID=2614688 RepID=A0A5J5K482_9ACTN|nr:CHAT domain-containing protein [Microbispora cellulosiformans]KAA9379164.1 tetratricopeptide repeat protein [Microbispora cellulosiformans]
MAEREDLLQALQERLQRVSATQDPSLVLEQAALTQAARLAETLRGDKTDLQALHLLGWLSWYRYLALPEGQDRADLDTAVDAFTPCFINGSESLPEPLLPVLAGRAVSIAAEVLSRALGPASQALLPAAVQLWQRIVNATPADHPERAGMLSNLGIALRTRFERTGAMTDLNEAIQRQHQAVQVTPTDHPDRAAMLSNLGSALHERFRRTGAVTDLNDAIQQLHQAVQITPTDHPNSAGRLSILGIALRTRFERTGAMTDLNDAIQRQHQAVQVTPTDHPSRAMYLSNLGSALHERFRRTGAMTDLNDAIQRQHQAVQITPTDHPNSAQMLSNLGIALQARFERTGATTDLNDAIQQLHQAVQITPTDHPNSAQMLSNLGIALQTRFERTGATTDLNEAIQQQQQAVQVIPADHPDRAGMLSNLGIALQTRFERTGATTDLNEAIQQLHQAVQVIPADHPNSAMYLSNLGIALRERFRRTGAMTDLNEAIQQLHQAVQVIPTDHPNSAAMLSNLGIALHERFRRTGAMTDLNEAIQQLHQAVQVTPTDHPNSAGRLSNLGIALQARFERTGATTDLNEAIQRQQQAVQVIPADHPDRAGMLSNLGIALQARFERTELQGDLDAALSAYMDAADIKAAAPSIRIGAARAGASLAASLQPGRAADLLEEAVRLLPQVAPPRLERSDQQHAIGRSAGLASDAAALALADLDTPTGERATRALRLLETARAVLLSQALHTRSDLTDLRERHPKLATRFVELRELLDQTIDPMPPASATTSVQEAATPRFEQAAWDRRQLAEEFTALLDHIRTLDGFGSFALPPTTEQLLAQAISGPVAVFTVSRHRSDALLLTTGGITALELPALTPDTVIDQIIAFHQALHTTTDLSTSLADRIGAQKAIRDILGWLWNVAAEPVLSALGYHRPPAPGRPWPRVWWATGGLLGLLPLHAAGHYTDPPDPQHRTVMDRVVSSYTPTVGALHHARQHIAAHPTPSHRGLIVAMPTTPGLPGQGRLPNVPAEAAIVRAHLPDPVLLAEPGDDAPADPSQVPTRANVLARLPGCAIAHFACHGLSNLADPSSSHLLLHDHQTTPLTIAALARVALDEANLAYLSACSTAFTATTELLDEAIHLASAFQLAGFPHVIGTLWPIDDAIAVTIADAFYTALTTNGGTLDPSRAAYALHQAIRAARDNYPTTPSLWAAHIHAGA